MTTSHVYTRAVELGAPPEVVFWDLLDPGNVAGYDSRFRSWVPREMPPRVGTKVDFVTRMFGMWLRGTSQFTRFEPPRHLEVRLVRPPSPMRSLLSWDLASAGAGTFFTYRFEITAPRGLGWAARLFLRQITSHLDTELPALAGRYSS